MKTSKGRHDFVSNIINAGKDWFAVDLEDLQPLLVVLELTGGNSHCLNALRRRKSKMEMEKDKMN